jgi:hypothetical protein
MHGMPIGKDVARKMFVAGLLMYGISFFLIATDRLGPNPEPQPGWNVALMAFGIPITRADPVKGAGWLAQVEFEFVAVKISGLINVVFVLAAIAGLIGPGSTTFKVFRIAVLLMMPFCWVVFRREQFYPREGYFLWTLGMLFVLFSERLGRPAVASATL